MNPYIDKLEEGASYTFMLSSGHHAIAGTLERADALLAVRGASSGVRDESLHYLNPDHVVAVRDEKNVDRLEPARFDALEQFARHDPAVEWPSAKHDGPADALMAAFDRMREGYAAVSSAGADLTTSERVETAEALRLLAGIDDGENTDFERLEELARRVEGPDGA